MTNFSILDKLSDISDNYDGFIVDIWGVLWDGIEPYEHSKITLEKLKENNKKIVLLSNAPRRSRVVSDKLSSIGINKNLYDTIISSGEVCRKECLQNKKILSLLGHNYYFIGQETDKDITLGLTISEASSIDESSFLLVCGTRDFDHTLDDYINELNQGLQLNLPLVCANPDKVVIRKNGQLLTCAGILADYYQSKGGTVFKYGKPFQLVYKKCLDFLKNLDSNILSNKLLVIGDSLETDILGANKNKLTSLLVTNGIHKNQLSINSNRKLFQKSLNVLCKKFSSFPDYTIKNFIF